MKKITEHQIVSILKEAEAGIPVKELCRKYSISNSALINDKRNTELWNHRISNI
ncbi:transposase [Snodgrassella sp. ESL0253]|nr:transposase [Snodgrassella sp. ESL0253]NUE67699.1 transposase [Snodgrassella sp. ESL0253]